MAKRFELHLQGMEMPEGLIDADRLVEIVNSLQEMATRLSRIETDSAQKGRPSRNLDRVASLRIGLEKGSTTIVAERDLAQGSLEIDLPDEDAVDRKVAELIEGIGADIRPDWVTDSVASAADDLVAALQRTAPKVEFKVDGISAKSFETNTLHRQTWKPLRPTGAVATAEFTGRLFAVNLNTHRHQIQDDVGNCVALPKFADDLAVRGLIGAYVTATGAPDVDDHGRITALRDAQIVPLDRSAILGRVPAATPVDEILASAPGLEPGGLKGLTDEEADSFLAAMGL